MTPGDAQSLGARFQRGDDSALGEMYQRYAGPMFVTAVSLLGDREQAADAVQRAFVQAWRAADGFDPRRELKPWLYAITRRAAVDVYRRERRNAGNVSLQVVREVADDGPSMDRIWRSWQVREALDQLPPGERKVLELAYYRGYSQSEIATELDLPLGTVKSRTSRAQRRLADLLPHLREAAHAVAS
ncbi:sigma-70 family RNA polymerase sigma factor [Kribbella sancticallisti]|uniref:Sigma-70 family RNA polymerase sigma factor n=1 Tax=Kribbella sancticallisti TaxID=460087 RepID=A0ABP4QM53_9ACTN